MNILYPYSIRLTPVLLAPLIATSCAVIPLSFESEATIDKIKVATTSVKIGEQIHLDVEYTLLGSMSNDKMKIQVDNETRKVIIKIIVTNTMGAVPSMIDNKTSQGVFLPTRVGKYDIQASNGLATASVDVL